MRSAICTLFEGHYHYGVAALVNSLHQHGYRGAVYAGFRGELPPWAAAATALASPAWPGGRMLAVADQLQLYFLPLTTPHHLTNYKPDFLLRLWDGFASEAPALFYFDPDIVVNMPWGQFEEWAACGVALCEDVNSPLAEYHPIRLGWRRYFAADAFRLRFKAAAYANGGFVGVSREHRGFLATWQALQDAMAPAIGGLARSAFTGAEPLPFAPFGKTDQDALNAAVEAWDGPVSFVGPEGMGFRAGTPLMSHALGRGKPWLLSPLAQAAAGQPPRRADRDYWRLANGVIQAHPAGFYQRRQLAIKIAAFIGRFYRRN